MVVYEIRDSNLRTPRYMQAYTALRDWIHHGAYSPGDRLPSEPQLCEIFGVSRITIRSAIDLLEREGLVARQQGRGTFVSAEVPDAPSRGNLQELVRRLRQLDQATTLADVAIATQPADPPTAGDLQLSPGEQIVRITYTRLRDGEPIGLTEVVLPARLGIVPEERELRGTPAPMLATRAGVDILGADQLIGATLADARTAPPLDVAVGTPLVHVRLLVLDIASRPVERLSAYYRADRYVHHVFLAAQPAALRASPTTEPAADQPALTERKREATLPPGASTQPSTRPATRRRALVK